MVTTIGLVCPPVGLICFVISNMARDIGLVNIYRGVMPFMGADLIRLALLVAFPVISLLLPNTMD
jgi:TRAP-type C4-dicarboxylate transport system permease large subunit